jgi:phospholipid/cholesterol/gamma-HCH transport system substrate-binding protein
MNSLDDFTRMRRFTQFDQYSKRFRSRKFSPLTLLFTLLLPAAISIGVVAFINDSNGLGYLVYAEFDSVEGLPKGASIEMAGVRIGTVSQVSLTEAGLARVQMNIEKGIVLSRDSLISVQSHGDRGDKIVRVLPGRSEKTIGSGETFLETESGGQHPQEI